MSMFLFVICCRLLSLPEYSELLLLLHHKDHLLLLNLTLHRLPLHLDYSQGLHCLLLILLL
jgi:hypothetical protein